MTARQHTLLRPHQTPLDANPPYVSASLFTHENIPREMAGEIDALNRQLSRARQLFPTTDAVRLFQRAHQILSRGDVGADGLFEALVAQAGGS